MVAARRLRARSARGGFTLVELAVVVVIVGVLSVIAVIGYRKMILSSKITEAQNMISAIRIAQEDYKTETGTYANIGTTWCPTNGTTQAKTGWNPNCGGTTKWLALPVHSDGPVQFGYRTAGGSNNFADPYSLSWIAWGTPSSTVPWYVIHAQADLDDDGAPYTELVGTSFQNTIFTRNEGE